MDPNILTNDVIILTYSCPKCHGEGKMDWIENIIGKRKDYIISRKTVVAATRVLKSDWKLENKIKYGDGEECSYQIVE